MTIILLEWFTKKTTFFAYLEKVLNKVPTISRSRFENIFLNFPSGWRHSHKNTKRTHMQSNIPFSGITDSDYFCFAMIFRCDFFLVRRCSVLLVEYLCVCFVSASDFENRLILICTACDFCELLCVPRSDWRECHTYKVQTNI